MREIRKAEIAKTVGISRATVPTIITNFSNTNTTENKHRSD